MADMDGVRRWKFVQAGLMLIYWGFIGAILCILLGLVLFPVIWLSMFIFGPTFAEAVFTLSAALFVVVALLCAAAIGVGHLLCLACPSEHDLRIPIVISLLGYLMSGMAYLALEVLFSPMGDAFFERTEIPKKVVEILLGSLLISAGAVGHVLFILFLRRIGRLFDHRRLIENSGLYLLLFAPFVAINGLTLVLLTASNPAANPLFSRDALQCIAGLLLVLGVVLFFQYQVLLRETVAALARLMQSNDDGGTEMLPPGRAP